MSHHSHLVPESSHFLVFRIRYEGPDPCSSKEVYLQCEYNEYFEKAMKEDGTVSCPYGGDDVSKIVSSKVELLLLEIPDGFIRRQGLLNPLLRSVKSIARGYRTYGVYLAPVLFRDFTCRSFFEPTYKSLCKCTGGCYCELFIWTQSPLILRRSYAPPNEIFDARNIWSRGTNFEDIARCFVLLFHKIPDECG